MRRTQELMDAAAPEPLPWKKYSPTMPIFRRKAGNGQGSASEGRFAVTKRLPINQSADASRYSATRQPQLRPDETETILVKTNTRTTTVPTPDSKERTVASCGRQMLRYYETLRLKVCSRRVKKYLALELERPRSHFDGRTSSCDALTGKRNAYSRGA